MAGYGYNMHARHVHHPSCAACEVARVCLASPHTISPDGTSLAAPLRVLSAIRDLQQSLLLHRVWQKSSTSLWGAMVQARLASETIRASLPYCTRAPIKPNSLSMLAEFLHSVRSTAHEVATSCVQGVLEAPEASQFSVPLATPGTLLHAVHHVLDWVLDECLDVVFCEGIEVRRGALWCRLLGIVANVTQMLVGATVHACIRAFDGTFRYATILTALPSLQRMHGAVDGAGQVNAAAAKHLRVRVVYVCHDTLQSCQHQMAAKAYYNDVFLDATNDAIMAMVQTGELVPASQTVPATLKAINTNAAVVVDVVPAPSKGTKRKQPPKGEVDVYTNQKGMRVLAARNMVAQHD